jgi:hypothetical protein
MFGRCCELGSYSDRCLLYGRTNGIEVFRCSGQKKVWNTQVSLASLDSGALNDYTICIQLTTNISTTRKMSGNLWPTGKR